MKIERIYHHWEKWEDHKNGFYDTVSGKDKETLLQIVVDLFSSDKLTEKYMDKVIKEWYYSCEHNLTNNGMNKIAYLGQGACCLYADIPATITMEAWSLVPKERQIIANQIAEKKTG